MDRSTLERTYEQHFSQWLEEWSAFLRFESISTDPAYDDECLRCAQWLCEHIEQMGLDATLLETPQKPVVYAEYKGKPGAPVVLYYGHYDVQPVDPVEDWISQPFAPEVREGRLYARGAQDNKGQTFYFLKALETLLKNDALGCTLRLFLEGEEESGSEGMAAQMAHWEQLQGDVLLVCDTGTFAEGLPTITMGLRGIVELNVRLDGIKQDLHSGVHGGVAPNPALEMARLLATLHDAEGRVAVEGFYEGVLDIDPDDRALANQLPITEALYEQMVGVPPVGGEAAFTPAERRGFRPTLEVNGLHSGYGGPGNKTIVPAHAIAKLSSRLAGDQDPQATLERIEKHLQKHAPKGLALHLEDQQVGGPALMLSAASDWVKKAHDVLVKISAKEQVLYTWEGASIPLISEMAKVSGAAPLLVGFGLEEDCIHAPNESFSLAQFKQGFLYAAMMLQVLSKTPDS